MLEEKQEILSEIEKTAKLCDELQALSLNLHGKYDLEKSMIWMTEEFGEVISAIRKKKDKKDITEEFGDLLTWIFIISNILNLKVSDQVMMSFNKEVDRQFNKYGKLKNS